MNPEPQEGDELWCPNCDQWFGVELGEDECDAQIRHRAMECRVNF